MKLYISTPINARSEATFQEKYEAARKRVEEIKEQLPSIYQECYDIVSSFDLNPLGTYTEEQAMGRCIQAVMESDAILLDDGWTLSQGCCLEFRTAEIYNKIIYSTSPNNPINPMNPILPDGFHNKSYV